MTGADKSGESTVPWGKWHPVRLACLTGGGAGLPEPAQAASCPGGQGKLQPHSTF